MTKIELTPAKYCYDCEEQLNEDNTGSYGGFDGGNYLASKTYGGSDNPDYFTKCDSCFDGDVDRYLERLYE